MYNTFHYYEKSLRERPSLRRRLVAAVLGSLKESLSEPYQLFLSRPIEDVWVPELDYYVQLVKRTVDTLEGKHKAVFVDIVK